MHRLRKKISKFWGFLRLFRKVVNASGLILAYPCSTCQDGNFDVAHDLIWNNFWKQKFFVKERRGDPLILKKIILQIMSCATSKFPSWRVEQEYAKIRPDASTTLRDNRKKPQNFEIFFNIKGSPLLSFKKKFCF